MSVRDRSGDRRCWPCTVANALVGLLIAAVPLAAALQVGDRGVVLAAVGWSVLVVAATAYRLLALGYLPYAETVARWTGLHDRIGPGRKGEE